jgi:hypothetical protein
MTQLSWFDVFYECWAALQDSGCSQNIHEKIVILFQVLREQVCAFLLGNVVVVQRCLET